MLGLGGGVDEFVCKPLHPREVVPCIKDHLRRATGQLTAKPPPWVIDDEKLRTRYRKNCLSLALLEFRTLRLLVRQPVRVFSHAQLLASMRSRDHNASDRVI